MILIHVFSIQIFASFIHLGSLQAVLKSIIILYLLFFFDNVSIDGSKEIRSFRTNLCLLSYID